jgi:hypothetical protein
VEEDIDVEMEGTVADEVVGVDIDVVVVEVGIVEVVEEDIDVETGTDEECFPVQYEECFPVQF